MAILKNDGHTCRTLIDAKSCYSTLYKELLAVSGLEISQNKICGGECDSCKFEQNKNILLFFTDVIGSYFRPCSLFFHEELWSLPAGKTDYGS